MTPVALPRARDAVIRIVAERLDVMDRRGARGELLEDLRREGVGGDGGVHHLEDFPHLSAEHQVLLRGCRPRHHAVIANDPHRPIGRPGYRMIP